jgi:hypothetical protein
LEQLSKKNSYYLETMSRIEKGCVAEINSASVLFLGGALRVF